MFELQRKNFEICRRFFFLLGLCFGFLLLEPGDHLAFRGKKLMETPWNLWKLEKKNGKSLTCNMSTRSRSFNKCCWISFKQIHMASEDFFPQVLICRKSSAGQGKQVGFTSWKVLSSSASEKSCSVQDIYRWDRIDKVTPHQTAEGGGGLIEYI